LEILGIVTLGIAILTLAFNVGFWVRTIRGFLSWRSHLRDRTDPDHWPRTRIFVCLKGNLPRLAETARALARQDYPGEFGITFVTEAAASEGDAAAIRLGEVLPDLGRSDHVVAGRVLDTGMRCAQKNFNLLAGIRHSEARHGSLDVYAFCDGDLLVRPSWLRMMVRPLATRQSEASTSFHYIAPEGRRLISALHGIAEACQSLAALVCRGATWGGSMAIRADVFERYGLAEIWSRTVVDDMTLSRVLKRSRLRVTPIAQFLVSSHSEITSYRSFVRWLGRQFFFVKTYLPSLYWVLGTMMALNVATLWLGAFHGGYHLIHHAWPAGPWAGGMAILTGVGAFMTFFLFRFLIPERPSVHAWFGASILVPGASLLACAHVTLRRRRLNWKDLTYFLEGDGRVIRVARNGRATPAEPLPGKAVA
jgi:cellulose synthase/poly-beta-1,6-N-acetylglucosamine synthase-like glycosyltransferase